MPVVYNTSNEIETEHWLKLLVLNVKNSTLTDKEFREFVKETLPSVQGYQEAKEKLKQAGKLIPGEAPMAQQDMPAQSYYDK